MKLNINNYIQNTLIIVAVKSQIIIFLNNIRHSYNWPIKHYIIYTNIHWTQ